MTFHPLLLVGAAFGLLQTPTTPPTTQTTPATQTGPISHTQTGRPDPRRCLTIVEGEGIRRTDAGVARIDLGRVDAVTTPRIERTATVRNDTAAALMISGVSGSCGCETLSLAHKGAAVPQVLLQPGEEAEVRVSLNTRRVSGSFLKYVWVNTRGSAQPLATLELSGIARELVRFSPRTVQFGALPAGSTRSLPLTVSVDAALLAGASLPALKSASPAVEAASEGEPRSVTKDGVAQVEQTYRVTLTSKAAAGLLATTLSFATASTPMETPKTDAEAVLRSAAVVVGADLRGALTVSPSVVLFGAVPAGRPARRQVAVSASSLDALKDLAFTSPSPHVSGALSAPEPAGTGGAVYMRILTITLKETAPVGPLQASAVLTTPSGQKTALTIVAEAVR